MSKKSPKASGPRGGTESLPARPDLEQLRRQAKELLHRMRADEPAADHRLADALLAVARRSGFASWPALSRHVQSLRALEGEWTFASLEVEGQAIPASMLGTSRILIDGDRFRTESPEATYEGEFRIDIEQEPPTLDIEFVEGPEAGKWSRGLFTLDGDRLTICLGLAGRTRPSGFRTAPGSGHALETLHRLDRGRPAGVTGGTRREAASANATPAARPVADPSAFAPSPSPLDALLAGRWRAEELVRDGMALPKAFLAAGERIAEGDEGRVVFGGRVMVHARVRYDATPSPAHVDYLYLSGEHEGTLALGIAELDGDSLRVNRASPGAPRPDDWASAAGGGRTVSRWRRR